jgi:cGMP-dependent protein kinase
MEPSGYLKIIDLGTARKLHSAAGYRSFTIIGTPHYMAP